MLVLGNKNDLPESLGVDELIEKLNLKALVDREVCCYSISAKNSVNIDITIDWLIKHSRSARPGAGLRRQIYSPQKTRDRSLSSLLPRRERRRAHAAEDPMSDGAPAAAAASGWFNFGGMLEGVLSWLRNLFFKQEMELTLVGLQNSGKTTLVNVVATGGFD